jgi:hypothetical protein
LSGYFTCPHCGNTVDIEATVCPECGSDDQTGWSEDTVYDDLFLYDADEDKVTHTAEGAKRWVKYGVIAILALTLSAFVAVTIPGGIYLVPVIFLATVAAYFLMEILPNMRSRQEKKIYEALLIRARGDEGMVERWISYERRRTPEADEADLMEAALYRWQRDNR